MAEENTAKKPPLVIDPDADVGQVVRNIVGHMGDVQDVAGGFKIKVHHNLAFNWDEVFKALLYRDYQVSVTRHKADLYIEARA